MVCTKAFGLGVDLPNVRWVLHYMMSSSLEDYYQEVGRSGRDGKPSRALLLYAPGYDYARLAGLLRLSSTPMKDIRAVWSYLSSRRNVGEVALSELVLALLKGRRISRRARLEGIFEAFELKALKALNALSRTRVLDYDVIEGEWYLVNSSLVSGEGGTRLYAYVDSSRLVRTAAGPRPPPVDDWVELTGLQRGIKFELQGGEVDVAKGWRPWRTRGCSRPWP